MSRFTKLATCVTVLSLGVVAAPPAVRAEACESYSEAPSSSSPTTLTIIDTEVGTDAYQRLVAYGSGGHKALGVAIASSYDYFGKCQYAGIGIMDGSGGNGFRPNFTLAIWHDGIDVAKARDAIYSLVNASNSPAVTNGDCNISCDGSIGRQYDGTVITPETTTTTTTIPVIVGNVEVIAEPQLENVAQVDPPVLLVEVVNSIPEQKVEIIVMAGPPVPSVNSYVKKKIVTKKHIVKRKKVLTK